MWPSSLCVAIRTSAPASSASSLVVDYFILVFLAYNNAEGRRTKKSERGGDT